jgi:hypothetical protein
MTAEINQPATYTNIKRRVLHVVSATAMALMLATTLTGAASDDNDRLRVPPMPDDIRVDEGHRLFFIGHAFGTQNYICLPSTLPNTNGFAWTLFGPQANLFNAHARQVMTHFLSPNPAENGTLRATWQESDDTSAVWARATVTSADANYVAPGAIPWLKLLVVGEARGPRGGKSLVGTTFIQRLNTTGGIAPAAGCAGATDVGARRFVPYTADYFFYRKAGRFPWFDWSDWQNPWID